MKKSSVLMLTLIIVFALGNTISAQITIQLPKIPKIKKPKIEQPKTTADDSRTVEDRKPETNSQNTNTDEPLDARLSMFLEDIAKAQKSVDEYTPEEKLYLVSNVEAEWLWRAVSPRERSAWNEKWKSLMTPATQKRFDAALAALAASAAKKLPAYRANLNKYKVRNPAEEKLMKATLENIADYKIFSIGLQESNWLIDKNDYGLPTARYKHGVIYLRNTKSDHPYCYATYVNVKQDYAGGGTYGASYARFIEDEMVGCPAAGK